MSGTNYAAVEPSDSEAIVFAFEVYGRGTIRARVREYRRKTYLDLRLFYVDAAGELQPTGKGISVHMDYAPELLAAVQALYSAVRPGELADDGADAA